MATGVAMSFTGNKIGSDCAGRSPLSDQKPFCSLQLTANSDQLLQQPLSLLWHCLSHLTLMSTPLPEAEPQQRMSVGFVSCSEAFSPLC